MKKEQIIKDKIHYGIPLSANEEANYLLLIATDKEYNDYIKNKNK